MRQPPAAAEGAGEPGLNVDSPGRMPEQEIHMSRDSERHSENGF
jgi:hypothetical protein